MRAFIMRILLATCCLSFTLVGGWELPWFRNWEELKLPEMNGSVCAYGDFNHDRFTDLLFYSNKSLIVQFQHKTTFMDADEHGVRIAPIAIGVADEIACAVGDLNGDGSVDIVVSMKNGDTWDVKYYFRKVDEHNESLPVFELSDDHSITLSDQVATIDVTGDGMHDIVGVKEDGSLFCREGERGVKSLDKDCSNLFMGWSGKLRAGHPIIFGDITNDLFAEIIFMRENTDNLLVPEVWRRSGKQWEKLSQEMPPSNSFPLRHTLAPFLGDIDRDSVMDFVVPLCKDAKCTTLENLQWINFVGGKWSEWKTSTIVLGAPAGELTLVEEEGTFARLRMGDYNLDGFPDLLATIVGSSKEKKDINRAVILENSEDKEGGPRARRFAPQGADLLMPGLAIGQTQSSHFFDFAEDGYLDILVQWKLPGSEEGSSSIIISSSANHDATYLKVETFAPFYPKDDIKYGKGVPWGGTCVNYEMETAYGIDKQRAVDCQLTSTSHKAGLSPPFSLLGLGRQPNFVDRVIVGVPRADTDDVLRSHEQKQIVPNARMMVQPPPSWAGDRVWLLRLYLTPSSLILSSVAVMASVCSLLLLVVLILHLREKKSDRVERQSHRFHFDAM